MRADRHADGRSVSPAHVDVGYPHGGPVDGVHGDLAYDATGRAVLQNASVLHRQGEVGTEEGMVGIVRDHEDPYALFGEAAHLVKHRVLVSEVEARS